MGKVLAVLVQGPVRIRNTYTKDGEVVCVCNPGDGWVRSGWRLVDPVGRDLCPKAVSENKENSDRGRHPTLFSDLHPPQAHAHAKTTCK